MSWNYHPDKHLAFEALLHRDDSWLTIDSALDSLVDMTGQHAETARVPDQRARAVERLSGPAIGKTILSGTRT